VDLPPVLRLVGAGAALVARARQFSSFILLVGRIASADVFEPRFGIIVQNKDVLSIPLMLEQIPTPKEFRDAIESLSPEQQRFARPSAGCSSRARSSACASSRSSRSSRSC
jgi:hypothetical protein